MTGGAGSNLRVLMRNYHENYLELAVDYGNAGLIAEAINLLERYNQLSCKEPRKIIRWFIITLVISTIWKVRLI
jgi:hypothetical protein